jgi:uncharacterized protein (TIRG00374 family)
MRSEGNKILWRAALPAAIGICVAVWLFHDEFQNDTWRSITFDFRTIIALVAAAVFVVGRDFGLTWRFHTLADGDLSWHRALRVDLMCAFTSAITPSAVGGSALAIFYLNREGVKLGRATTLTLTTLFLDELFFVVFCPILFLLIPAKQLFGSQADNALLGSIQLVFWLVYAGIVIWTGILYTGIIAKPRIVGRTFLRLFSIKILRRWRPQIYGMTENMSATAAWVKGRSMKWWLNIFGATTLSWFSRYFIVNSLFWGFVADASGLLVFGRQFVVWVVLMISPTPGGSGISEWLFANYYGDLIGNVSIALILALIWRVLSYYIYLIIGACLVPSYFRRKK